MSVKVFVCEGCGSKHKKWSGKCTECGEWNSIVEDVSTYTPVNSSFVSSNIAGKIEIAKIDVVNLEDQAEIEVPRISSGLNELDRVLGGGFVKGSAILIGGDPGIGKSTLLLQACSLAGKGGLKVLYVYPKLDSGVSAGVQ